MATLIHLCGFEEGGYPSGPYGEGVHDYTSYGGGDALTWDTGIKRNGRFSLKMAPSGSSATSRLRKAFSATNHIVASFWFRWEGTSGTVQVIHLPTVLAGIRITSGGVLSASAGSTYTNGATVAADTWHLLEFYWNGSANPHVVKWRVNDVAQTDVSYAVAAATETAFDLTTTTASGTNTFYFDDWGLSVTGADYPLGPIAVEGHIPTGDGTHSNQSHFKDEANVVSSGSSTYTKVVPTNGADYWRQSTANAASYLEWTLNDTTRTNPILGASVSIAIRKNGAIGTSNGSAQLRANSNDGTVYTGDFGYGGGAWFGKSALFLTAPGGAAWTPTIVNGATIRFGYATDVNPQPFLEMAVLEVAYDDDPDETTGGDPEPDPEPDHVPGIWIDWEGDGTGWTNETTRVVSMTWSRGASFDHVSAAGPGNATLVVQNDDHRFNPDYAAGPLYGLLLPARPVWAGANVDTGSLTTSASVDVRGFFGGYISEIVPTPVPGGNPTAEILCEDAFGWYRRATATVSPERDISRGAFRQAVLTSIGEDVDRRDLESEADMLPFASADTRDALSTLDELNRSNSSRHFIAPADFMERTYYYTLVNRLHKLAAAADESWNGDDVQDLSGYRVTVDNVDNLQRATVSPINFGSVNEVVWTATPLPMVVTVGEPITLWAEFADFVFDGALQINSSGGTLASTLTNFGTSAKIELTASGSVVNITSLDVTGSSLRRGDLQTVRSEDTASQTAYGVRAGGDVSTDYIGQPGAAKAVTDYLVWKFAEPLKRPTVTRSGKDATTIASLLERDLFDVITLTVDRLDMVARRFEIIGLRGTVVPGGANPFYTVSYELQETPNQAALDYFEIDVDSINGAALIAPF